MIGTPSGWRTVTLNDVARWGSGGTPTARDSRYYGGAIPWAVIGDLDDGPLLRTASTITEEGLRSSSAKRVPPNAVLIAMYGSIGKLGITTREVTTNQAIAFAIPHAGVVEVKYLFYYLMSQRAPLAAAGKGATQRNIGQGVLKAWPIPLPSLNEQRRIVEILDDQLSRLDAAERYLGKVLDKGSIARGAVLQSAIARRETFDSGDVQMLLEERARRFPPGAKRGRPSAAPATEALVPWAGGWPTVSLEEATDPVRTISYGILKPGPNLERGVPYVRVLNMRDDRLALLDLHRTSSEIAAQYSRASLKSDDVLVSIRGTYGRVVLVPMELEGANITQDTARLAILPQLLPSFVALVLRSPWAQAYLKRVARGVGVKGVNISDLRRVPLPLPSLALQARIVAQADEMISDVEAATRSAQAGALRSASLRRAILAAAFAGRLARGSFDMTDVGELRRV